MRQFFASGGQSIRISASASDLPMNIQDWFLLGWYVWISAIQETLKSHFQHHSSKASVLWHSNFFIVQLSHPYMTIGKTIALTIQTISDKVMPLLFNMLFFQGTSVLISWLQSPSAVILEPPKIQSVTVSTVSPSICHELLGRDAMILVFWILSFMTTYSLSSFTFIKSLFSSLFSAIRLVSFAYLRLLIFLWQSWFQLVVHPVQHFSWCTLHISYISRVTIYILDVLLSQFGISLLLHVQF